MSLRDAVKDFPMQHSNDIFPNGTYSFWQLLEHIRITQRDIIEFMINPRYKELSWPQEYWPKNTVQATPEKWRRTVNAYEDDLQEVKNLVENKDTHLFDHVPSGSGQTFLREVLLLMDHTAYHVGEFGIMRQVLKLW